MSNAELISRLQNEIRTIESAPHSGSKRKNRAPSPNVANTEGLADDGARARCDSNDAFKKIIALVNVSDRSEVSIRDRLARCDFTSEEIDSAVDRAKDYGFIDDSRYAGVLIRSRIAQGKGSAGIERELWENGIDASTVPGWPDEYQVSYDEELERAINLLNRKPPRSKNLREGAYRKLVQKGYSSSVASSAARVWEEGHRQ